MKKTIDEKETEIKEKNAQIEELKKQFYNLKEEKEKEEQKNEEIKSLKEEIIAEKTKAKMQQQEEHTKAKEIIEELTKQNEELRTMSHTTMAHKSENKEEKTDSTEINIVSSDKSITKSREIVEQQLIAMIKKGESNPNMVDILVQVYANMVEESEFRTDESGTLKVGEGRFLRHVNQNDLNHQQILVGKQIIEAMHKQFPITVVKKARRLSISMKRNLRVRMKTKRQVRGTRIKEEKTLHKIRTENEYTNYLLHRLFVTKLFCYTDDWLHTYFDTITRVKCLHLFF